MTRTKTPTYFIGPPPSTGVGDAMRTLLGLFLFVSGTVCTGSAGASIGSDLEVAEALGEEAQGVVDTPLVCEGVERSRLRSLSRELGEQLAVLRDWMGKRPGQSSKWGDRLRDTEGRLDALEARVEPCNNPSI
jgi:hypothetical protein